MPPTEGELLAHIQALKQQRASLRAREKQARGMQGALNLMQTQGMGLAAMGVGSTPESFKRNLGQFLPDYLMPGNVGPLSEVAWPFWHAVSFDFGVNPTIGVSTSQRQSFQVSQEAALLLMSVSRDSFGYDTAGKLGPWTVQVQDRQSTRQLQANPIPFQSIGEKSLPKIFPTPMLFFPNAFVDVTMGTHVTQNQVLAGTAQHNLLFFGYRVRVEDASKVIKAVFSLGD